MIELKHLVVMVAAVTVSSCGSSNRNDDRGAATVMQPEINGYMLTSFTATGSDDQLLSESIYRFDDLSNTSFTKYVLDVNEQEVADVTYGINSDGTLSFLEVLEIGTSGTKQKQSLTYDSSGRLSLVQNNIGSLVELVEFQYLGGQINTKTITSTAGSDAIVFTYTYNESQDLVSIEENDSVNGIVSTMSLFYDGRSQLVRAEFDELTDGEVEESRVFGRDSNGNVTSITYYDEDNTPLRVETFGYERVNSPVVNLVEFDNTYFLF